MTAGTSSTVREPGHGPVLVCHRLPGYSLGDFEEARRAFEGAQSCRLGQGWLAREEPHFDPGIVRVGWRGDSLLVFAELEDVDIHTGVTGPNQRAWELGDTFEMFLQPAGQAEYVEFHVTPNNQHLQARFENAAALERARKSGSLDHVLVPGQAFHSAAWVRPDLQRWWVCAEIPARAVGQAADSLAGHQWRFSFSRYDYTRGRAEPVISSSSPHGVADFHRQQDWGWLQFKP